MVSMNRVILAGNLTRDPELKTLPSGAAVCSFSIAVNRKWTDKSTGEKREEVSFFDIEAWNRVAELVAQYLKKGRGVLLEGRLKQDRWETDSGDKRSKIKIQADQVQFLGSSKDDQDQAPRQQQPAEQASGNELNDENVPF